MNILTLETTCDETAAAVVNDRLEVLGAVVASQDALHQRFGGVVPEIASRAHVERILPVIDETLKRAGKSLAELDAIAIANTPGLAGSLLVGLAAAKGLAVALGKPLVAINHLQAHIYACRIASGQEVFPCLGMIVSGGHTSLYRCLGPLDFELLGATIDDAAGEAFDKVANMLGLPYPGGPSIQRAAAGGNPAAYRLPRPLLDDDRRLDFSFSGLKTAVLRLVQELRGQGSPEETRGQKLASVTAEGLPADAPLADIAASFQAAVVDALVQKTANAVARYDAVQVLIAGGVAANKALREEMSRRLSVPVRFPPIQFCTDNAAMVAAAGYYRFLAGKRAGLDLDVVPSLALT